MTDAEKKQAILEIFPNAAFEHDNNGQLTIYTGENRADLGNFLQNLELGNYSTNALEKIKGSS